MQKYKIRKSEKGDIPGIMNIISRNVEYFAKHDIPQWQWGYPNEDTFDQDIQAGNSYVLEAEGIVIATAAVIAKRDEDYDYIENGSWLNDEDYIVIHRIAVDPAYKGKGLAAKFLDFARELAEKKGIRNLRVDTHQRNSSMDRFLRKNGFVPCGTVYIRKTDERIGYQKVLIE